MSPSPSRGFPALLLAELPTWSDPSAPELGGATRPEVAAVDGFGERYPEEQSAGILRASLIVTHAVLRRFFP